MKASDIDQESPSRQMPGARDWLRAVGAAIGVILICILWTFWA